MPFLRPYNTLLVTGTTGIRIPIIKRASVDFAVSADWTPSAGDVTVKTGAGASGNITNLPTAITRGNTAEWEFILTAAELSGKTVTVLISDAATKVIEDQCFIVETYGNASAMYAADLSLANLPANVTQLLGTAWLAPGVAGTPDVNTKLVGGQTASAAGVVTFPGTIASTTNITAGTITTTTNLTNLPAAAALEATAQSIKTKTDFLPSATAGAAGGVFIAGSNAATTAATWTVTGATTHTGHVLLSDGLAIAVPSTLNRDGFKISGNGTGDALKCVAGLSTGAAAIHALGNYGLFLDGLTASAVVGTAFQMNSTGVGMEIQSTGIGFWVVTTAGGGVIVEATEGYGMAVSSSSTNATHDALAFTCFGDGDGIDARALGTGVDIRGDITGNLTGNVSGSVGSVTGLTPATVHSDLDDIQARLPAALTGAGNMKADALALNGDVTAAATLAILNGATVVYRGTVTGAATTTTLIDSGLTQASTDWWKGRIIIFTSVITMQATDITAFDPATDKLTFTLVTAAPTGATYVII